MKRICAAMGLVAISTALLVGSAWAQDATPAQDNDNKPEAVEPPTNKPITVTIDNYVTFDNLGAAISTHEIDIVLEGQVGNLILGADLWGGFSKDYDLETHDIAVPGLELYAISDTWGELHLWDADGALSNACIQPTEGSSHFGTEDLLSFGTCAAYSGQTILYISPQFNGFSVQLSAMRDIEELSEVGDVDSAVSAALTYNNSPDAGIEISASLGADFATSLNGGLPPDSRLPGLILGAVASRKIGEQAFNGYLRGYEANQPVLAQWDEAKELGANLLLTHFVPGTVQPNSHWSWMYFFNNEVLRDWLFSQSK